MHPQTGSIDASRFFVANLPGWPDEGVVIAACRAGASGTLNLEAHGDLASARASIRRVDAFAKGPFGVKLDAGADFAAELLSELPAAVNRVFLTVASSERLAELAGLASGREVWLESTSVAEAKLAQELGFAGVLAKGHEAGGPVGEETAFVLLQRLVRECSLPVIVAGGVGRRTAAALQIGGAYGCWLDIQAALLSESTLPPTVRDAITAARGDESICLGRSMGAPFRVFRRPGMKAVEQAEAEHRELEAGGATAEQAAAWRSACRQRIQWSSDGAFWPLGEDVCLAAELARDFPNVAGLIRGLVKETAENVETARAERPWRGGSPFAASHRTGFPVFQGPMTRVSDSPAFAHEVAQGGGLPFLALALLRGPQVRKILEESRELMGDLSWGVGILGFVPPELRAEQLEVVREVRPPFALIAGGRPDQAAALERDGIATYLHVPSPALLETFLDQGAKRFIFEGKECGGHTGPRTSFVLWEQAISVLVQAIDNGADAASFDVVFAGGIHDQQSAAMVAGLAAPLYKRGARVGLLMGTAYIFTEEAVRAGAIIEGFQQQALACADTALLESGPGHVTRCVRTPFVEAFHDEKRKLLAQGLESREIRDKLEALNVGRLRIASKGIERTPEPNPETGSPYATVDPDRQMREGVYMIGQVAAMHASVCTIAALHDNVCEGSSRLLESQPSAKPKKRRAPAPEPPCDVAIVGMSCLLPGARNHLELWDNIVSKRDAVDQIPSDRFNVDLYYDEDKNGRDTFYSKWGGFLNPVAFDPMRYGIPPKSLDSIDPMQLLSLLIVDQALSDAGYAKREFDRERTSVIFGMSGGLGDLGIKYAFRSSLREYFSEVPEKVLDQLPEWTEDSFAGILMNVTSGRIANRLGFGGVNFTVDAACASSLTALYLGARELNHGDSDVVVVGGCDTVQSPFGYMCFGTSKALSARGKCRPFDSSADGIAISEGVGALILRRLEDAERDGDRIYSVVRAVQGSSDGKGRGLTAPLPAGQVRVLRRAYSQARFSPSTVGLVEAHGTGTVVGDATELESLSTVFREENVRPGSCAVGSVKSMIGHTKSSAGVAGLMKVALSLYKGVQPPTLHVEKPNPKLLADGSPFYVNVEAQPWASTGPRRGGVSSFGFGGTNFHAILEEYGGEFRPLADRPPTSRWPAELFFWAAADRAALGRSLEGFERKIGDDLAAMAAESWRRAGKGECRAAIVATSPDDLQSKLSALRDYLAKGESAPAAPEGCWCFDGPADGKLALLFSGQGSQKPFMLRDLALRFPEIRQALSEADAALEGRFDRPLSAFIYPPHPFSDELRKAQQAAVTDTSVAQPALGAVEVGLLRALSRLGVQADMTAGHSYGEYAALHAAGAMDAATLFRLSAERGASIKESVGDNPGAMAAVSADGDEVRGLVEGLDGLTLANFNSPQQTVVAGSEQAIERAIASLAEKGAAARKLPVACAFHSPFMEQAATRFAAALQQAELRAPLRAVYSNTTAEPHSADTAEIVRQLERHLTSPVRWVEQVERMYADGARVFFEVGPGAICARLVEKVLGDRPDVTILSCEGRAGDPTQVFLGALAALAVRGAIPQGGELFRGRLEQAPNVMREDAQWRVFGGGAFHQDKTWRAPQPVQLEAPAQPASAPGAPAHQAPAAVPAASAPAGMPAPPAPPAVADDGVDQVMIEYSRMMTQFITSQADLMSKFLGSEASSPALPSPAPPAFQAPIPQPPSVPTPPVAEPPAAAASAPAAPTPAPGPKAPAAPARSVLDTLLAIASERTGYPSDMLDVTASLEADLGVDSIKRVEIVGAFQKTRSDAERAKISDSMEALSAAGSLRELADVLESLCEAQAASAAPAAAAPAGAAPRVDVLDTLLAIASERTGYPSDMLDVTASLEADLGVDSIKRVEIIGAFQKTRSDAERAKISSSMEALSAAGSLRDLAEVLETLCGDQGAIAPAHGAPAPDASGPAAEAAPTAPQVDVLQTLLAIASERTGYPSEMLDVTASLEADLGVDSIKRVEIIGAFQKTRSDAERAKISASMEELSAAGSFENMAAVLESLCESAAQPAAKQSEPGWSAAELLARLTQIASESTGYPVDSLDPTAGLEADLGIDSIKRVEIIGAFQKSLGDEQRGRIAASMEQLSAAGSLQELAAQLEQALSQSEPADEPAPAEEPPATMILTAVERPRTTEPSFQPGRVTLIAGEPSALADELATLLREGGETAVRLLDGASNDPDGGLWGADLADEASVERALEGIRKQYGRIGAVLALVDGPSGAHGSNGSGPSFTALKRPVRSAYLLARATFDDLSAAAAGRQARFVLATRRGGRFGLNGSQGAGLPTANAAADFLKCLAAEEPAFGCKIVDAGPDVKAKQLLDEFNCDDWDLQVGLDGQSRWAVIPQLQEAPTSVDVELPKNPVFLITGGGRGVTSQIAKIAAAQPGARLIVVGSTALTGDDPSQTARLEGPELKRAILEELRSSGASARPVDVEAQYRRITRRREIRATMADLAARGAEVDYRSVDVRDADAFAGLIDELYERYGRIDVVVHGAGIIEDKLVRDKTPESFDRVFDTKAISTLVLSRKLRPESLCALVCMSSISAAFGNRGQADYAAANGFMNGLAQQLSQTWGPRVTAMNWGPWDQRGMVSEGIRKQFEERGVKMIPLVPGAQAVFAEIGRERLEPILVVGDGPWSAEARTERVTASELDA